jgi:uracil-DNA glycosylase
MKVLFVGDQPSRKNDNPATAFKGTQSGVTLEKWATFLGVTYFAINSHSEPELYSSIKWAEQFNQPIITLGASAKQRVESLCYKNGFVVEIYHLPHPSPLNRKLNNKPRLFESLLELKHKLERTEK